MVTLPLTQGKVAIIDDEDASLVAPYSWCAVRRQRTWYAAGSRGRGRGVRREYVLLHRLICPSPTTVRIDHANGDGLDCRRSNLRRATPTQNNANAQKTRRATSSRFKGVYLHSSGSWKAQVVSGGRVRVRYAKSEIAAAEAYNEMALEAFGEFARLNVLTEVAP